MNSFRVRILILLATVLPLLSAHAAIFGIDMRSFQFQPKDLTINVGDTVTWSNFDSVVHDTVSGNNGVPDGNWNSNDQYGRLMRPGESFSHTFNQSGTYPYYCTPHWEFFGMTGTITVLRNSAGPIVTITSPAFGQTFSIGETVTIEATATVASGTVNTVEFFVNGTLIGTDTTAPYSMTTAALSAGEYSIVVKATDSFDTSSTAGVDITVSGQLPAITVPPQSQIVAPSNNVIFSVSAVGSAPLTYQWSFNNNAIANATQSTLNLLNVSEGDSGTYRIRVDNSFGFATAAATLLVTSIPPGTPPRITVQPISQTVPATSNVTFSVNAIGSGLLRYQWYFNQGKLLAATNSNLVLKNVSTNSAGNYFAVINNAFGRATSATARLSVVAPESCSYSIAPVSSSFGPAGGNGSVALSTGPFCTWKIVNTNSWITLLNGTGGMGSRTVSFQVSANSGKVRTGNILIAGKLHSIKQAGAIPSSNDFNHDGSTDFLWQHNDGRLIVWLMNSTNLTRYYYLRSQAADTNWQVVATADFNRDNHPDVLWQHSNGAVAAWIMNSNSVASNLTINGPQLGPLWRLSAVADLNNDGKVDFIFRHRDGYLVAWTMNGTTFVSQAFLFDGEPVPAEWRIAGAADFSGDGRTDVLWQRTTGEIVIWTMSGGQPTVATQLRKLAPAGARIAGVADFNYDNKTDLIWRHGNGVLSAWLMNGTNYIRSASIYNGRSVSLNWKVVAPRN